MALQTYGAFDARVHHGSNATRRTHSYRSDQTDVDLARDPRPSSLPPSVVPVDQRPLVGSFQNLAHWNFESLRWESGQLCVGDVSVLLVLAHDAECLAGC